MFLPHLSLAVTEISYRCCCRRPVWKLCEISESETGTRRSCHPFSGTRPHSSSRASDLRLCTHLGERKTSEVDSFTLLREATRMLCARVNSCYGRGQFSSTQPSRGTRRERGQGKGEDAVDTYSSPAPKSRSGSPGGSD